MAVAPEQKARPEIGRPAPGLVYLNNAATGWPRAPGVADAMAEALATLPTHPGRTRGRGNDAITECRSRLAGLLKVSDPTRVVLTVNATHALNLAILGLDLPQGARVVTTITEHNSVLRPINRLARRRGVEVTIVGLNGSGALDVEAYQRALGSGVSLVAVNHASNVTGRVNDVAPLFDEAKRAGALTLLDASQSLGHLPIDVEALSADLVAFTGHKGIHGPPGTGGLYVAPGIELHQVFVGGTGVRSDLAMHPEDMPVRMEAGTPNVPALAGLAAALRWFEAQGDNARAVENRLTLELRNQLKSIPGVKLFDDVDDVQRIGVASICIDGWSVSEAGCALEESFGICTRTGLHCAPLIHQAIGSAPDGTIRLSVSGFNTEEDIAQGARAVAQLCACT